jgi:hypothetical protein
VTTLRRAAAVAVTLLVLVGVVAGCAGDGTGVRMTNAADDLVTVRSPDGDVTELEPDGGAFTDTGACLDAPLVVTYDDGDQLTVDAPLCPGQELLVDDGSVSITAPSSG